ncbi:MAG: hypothetical protein ABIQ53_04570 [Terracoccus sp.]
MVVCRVLSAHGVPEPAEKQQVDAVDDGEGGPVVSGGAAGEDGEQGEHSHLEEDVGPGAALGAAVEVVVDRPLTQAIQMRENTTANRPTPGQVTSPERW